MTTIQLGHDVVDVDQALIALDRAECADSLAAFIRLAWPIVEPGQPYTHGWHIDAMCEHLEAITWQEIPDYNRLLINIPPGTMKSLCVSVFWPAWEWGPQNMPHLRYLCASHSLDIGVRDSMRMRRLVSSDWFQDRWPHVVLTKDQNQKTKFENTATGFRQAVAAGSITGSRGDRVICFPADELVHTEHGLRSIGSIVEDRSAVKVWSADPLTGKRELKRVIGWHRNPASQLVEVGLSDGSRFRCTPDHRIWTGRGWVAAGLLQASDRIPNFPASNGFYKRVADGIPLAKSAAAFMRRHDFLDLIGRQFMPGRGFSLQDIAAATLAFGNRGPICASPDFLYGSAFDAIPRRKRIGGFSADGDLGRLFAGQDRARSVFQNRERPMSFGVRDIVGARSIAKIEQSAIRAVAVMMAHFLARSRRPDKRQHHDLMDKHLRRLSVPVGVKSRVAFGWRRFKDFLRDREASPSDPWDDAAFAANAAHIADAVKSFKARNRFPLFVRDAGHVDETFCLTVEDHHTFFVGNGNGVLVANCDDPHSVEGAASDQMRQTTIEWFTEAVPTRLNNPDSSAIVVVMQRLHEEDVSGVILDRQLGYDHLCLPMRATLWRKEHPTRIGFVDPREEEGELLFPERFPEEVVARDERVMGIYATAGQFQQEPAPRGGGVIKREWWQLHTEKTYPPMDFIIASLDTAYTEKTENDFSALTVWGVFSGAMVSWANKWAAPGSRLMDIGDQTLRFDEAMQVKSRSDQFGGDLPRAMLMTAWAERLELHALVLKVAQTCRAMKVDRLLIEDKAAGHSVAQELRRLFGHEDWSVQLVNPGRIDKLARLHSVSHLFAEGMIYAPDKAWADMVIQQVSVFPKGKHDDLVDCVSMSLRHLRDAGMLKRAPEWAADAADGMRATGGDPPPIYPG
jgi:predicted phage terminase large subunit-like protein